MVVYVLSFSTTDPPPDQQVIEYKLRLRTGDHETFHKTEWTKAKFILEPRPGAPNSYVLKLRRCETRKMNPGNYVKWKIRLYGQQQKWWSWKRLYWINLRKWLYANPPLNASRGWLPVRGQEIFIQDNDQMIAPGPERVDNYSVAIDA